MNRVAIPYWIQALNSRVGLKDDHFQVKSDVEVLKDVLETEEEYGRGCDLSYTFQQLHSQLAEMREEQE